MASAMPQRSNRDGNGNGVGAWLGGWLRLGGEGERDAGGEAEETEDDGERGEGA